MLTDEKEMCFPSTGNTDFSVDGQGSDCVSLHTHTKRTPVSPEDTSSTTSSYHHSSTHLGYEGNRDYAEACRAWTIKHKLDMGSVDGSGP